MAKTVQIGLRIDKDLLKKIGDLADFEGIDKMSFMRRALAEFVDEVEECFEDAAIEDFIKLRIDEKELKGQLGIKEIAKDIKEARKEYLKKFSNKGRK